MPSASLVPPPEDTSTLLTIAGMQPFKPYFRGLEEPPAPRVCDCQRCFRTPDIEEVGNTAPPPDLLRDARQLELRRLLQGAVDRLGLGALGRGLRLRPRADLGDACSAATRSSGSAPTPRRSRSGSAQGVPEERIVQLPRSENFWQAGPTGPCGPCSEMYLDRGAEFGADERAPRRRHRPLPRVLEPRLHDLRAARGRLAHRAAEAEHRHRHGPRADGGDPAGRRLGLRDRRASRRWSSLAEELSGAHLRIRRRRRRGRCGSSPTTRAAPST